MMMERSLLNDGPPLANQSDHGPPRSRHDGRPTATTEREMTMERSLLDDGPPLASQSDTAFFWHVPKSGGTSLQRLYWCMGSTVARAGEEQ